MLQTLYMFFKPHLFPLLFALVIVGLLPLLAGYVVLLERKVMADMQARLGPMRVGPHGLLQPIADAVKLLMKEDIIPESADKWIFWLAPLLSVTAAMLAMSALPIGPVFQIADMNVGLLFILGIGSRGIFGIVLGGWASNSHYSLLGALRSAAQLVSYETAAGMAVVSAVMLSGTLSTRGIVEIQSESHLWFIFLVPVGFFLYLVASIAETNRAPFDLPEAESELVAGYMTEYSGFRWALYFLAEYTNMIVVASIATTLFLGGWLRPFPNMKLFNFLDYVPMLLMLLVGFYSLYRAPKQPVAIQKMVMVAVAGLCFILAAVVALPQFAPVGSLLGSLKPGIHGAFWFIAKVGAYLYVFLWLRFTCPRYRFDQLMKLG
jgi:NADH-quinone oxidoreductase subunit H